MRRLIIATLCGGFLGLLACQTQKTSAGRQNEKINATFFVTKSLEQLEYFQAAPMVNLETAPLLVFIHGHQEKMNGQTEGGAMFTEVLRRWASKGFLAVSVSQPGYGESEGAPDFCGPKTQKSIAELVESLRANRKVILWGISRGASVAAMIAAKHTAVDGVVLIGGLYDFESAVPNMPSLVYKNLLRECGITEVCLSERSLLKNLEKYEAKTLIIHGEQDDRSPFSQAKQLHAELLSKKVSSELHSFAEHGHMVPIPERNQFIDPFILGFK